MDDKFLLAGWNMSGGLPNTNADGTISRTKRLVDCGQVGTNTITATSGGSSKSLKFIIPTPYITIVDSGGNPISVSNGNNLAIGATHKFISARLWKLYGVFKLSVVSSRICHF